MDLNLRSAPGPVDSGNGVSAPPIIRVVVADDHASMRHGLRQVLDGEDGVEVVAEAVDLASAIDAVRSEAPHVLVLGLYLPAGSRRETIAKLGGRSGQTQVVIVGMHQQLAFAQQALASGALGFVLKDRADSELAAAVRAAASGQRYLSPPLAERLDAAQQDRER
jgi:two-component system response regulator NreC